MPEVECKNLSFSYLIKGKNNTVEVFKDLNIKFENHKFNVLLGESGSGKTTLLNIIAGIQNQYDGQLTFDGKDARELSIRRRNISYMPQNYVIYDRMTVFDNIAFPLKFVDISPEEVLVRVRNIAKRLGIAHCLSRKPKYLSFGQQQRMVLAKALVKDPDIILLDEDYLYVKLICLCGLVLLYFNLGIPITKAAYICLLESISGKNSINLSLSISSARPINNE